jgi:hypothetical protein
LREKTSWRQQLNLGSRSGNSLDNLNGTVRTLDFACSADQALFDLDRDGFGVFDLKNAYGTSVYAGFASIALIIINYYFYHVLYLS